MENIFQFQKDYDDVKIIKLEQNYRSTSSILNAANHIINFNQNQIKKSLWTDKGAGEKIKIVCSFTDNDEGKFVADLEKRDDVKLFIKLPNWFTVPTPVGEYNPDWAIVMEDRDEHGELVGKPLLY
ncbi:MAG: 3'-5' exonuclease, partial [Sphaerospermopsis kisseleviana]